MPQYAVMIFENVPPDQLSPEVMEAHGALPGKVADAGGRVAAGLGWVVHKSTAVR